ncbi:peptidyl-prolyl cis-trans isomerase sig-7 isoform X2 [Prorops nasuta]|uniref:peptidyl-prolyl cis-trans isomerase sig-7 isoform X2 n=1 Tax=Prorops nasuta TaxID=863751 RepID=UPI0034CF1408
MAVVIETTIGDFTVDLYTDERPQTCRNFLKLCKVKYYNWNLFHSVQSNFIAQTGDPTGTGKGGESIYGMVLGEKARYYEVEQMPKIKHNRAGLLSMVNCGNNMLGSQFFITLAPELQSLDAEHCVFGEITEGLEIILKFNEAICDDRSPEPTKEALMSDRIGADEIIDDTAGMTVEEITEMQKEKEAKARATILEIVGDIPDAEMAPPENVLFVCKLNPVTNDDDLEIIFSRFGKIVSCEVIRDRQTGDSLQYAFIEFAERKSCEEAYFKMDNVLIDDRRIHVDFSQSVAKMRWKDGAEPSHATPHSEHNILIGGTALYNKGIQHFENNGKESKEDPVKREKYRLKNKKFEGSQHSEETNKRKLDYNRHNDSNNHRKHERRKEYEKEYNSSKRYSNYYERSVETKSYENSHQKNNYYSKNYDDEKRRETKRNRDRSKDRADSNSRKEKHERKDDKHNMKHTSKRRDERASTEEKIDKSKERHERKKKRTNDRSDDKYSRSDNRHRHR